MYSKAGNSSIASRNECNSVYIISQSNIRDYNIAYSEQECDWLANCHVIIMQSSLNVVIPGRKRSKCQRKY